MDSSMSIFNSIILVFVLFAIIGFIISVTALIICLRFFISKDRNGERSTTPAVLAAFAYSFVIFNLIIAYVLVFSMVVFPSLPNSDYIETGISIEESGFQSEQFTVNGVEYTALDFLANYDYCDVKATPAFNYHTDGFAQGSFQSGMYHRLENGGGFDIIYHIDSGTLFCPASDQNDVYAYYNSVTNLKWYEYYLYTDEDGYEAENERLLSETASIALSRLNNTYEVLAQTQITLEDYSYYVFDLYTRSNDEIVNESYYYYLIGTEDGNMYVWEEDIKYEDSKTEMLVRQVPENIALMLDELWYY